MNNLDKLNDFIENINIPDDKLNKVIEENLKRKPNTIKINLSNIKKHIVRKIVPLVASILIIFGLTINTNSIFAEEVYKIPLVGQLAKLITFRQYSFENENSKGNITIPKLELSENLTLQNKINSLIQEKINTILEEQAILDAEYKEAYLATGGTEESYHKIETEVDYRLNYVSEDLVSFMIWKYQTLAPAYNEEYYYNFDISTGKRVTLKDLIGDNYQNQIKQIVQQEINLRMEKDPTLSYNLDWLKELEIREDRNYYINENGDIIVVFDKYEIASGAMGKQEFKIGSIKENY